MRIRNVCFPCGRYGLEIVQTFEGDMGGVRVQFDYFYNQQNYRDFARSEGIRLRLGLWDEIEGVLPVADLKITDIACSASSNWM